MKTLIGFVVYLAVLPSVLLVEGIIQNSQDIIHKYDLKEWRIKVKIK
jgi:hypothetical protein